MFPDGKYSAFYSLVCKLTLICFMQMTVLKSANKELKGMMKTVKIQDIDVRSLALFASMLQRKYLLLTCQCLFSVEFAR